nr:uncharacterized protein LOC113823339 [Penaeus vannamei]
MDDLTPSNSGKGAVRCENRTSGISCSDQFRCGRRSVEKASIPGRPQSAIDEDIIHQVETVILEDRRITIRQLPDVKISEDFFDRLFTQDETCVHYYDPETKAQSKHWKHFDSPTPKKRIALPQQARSCSQSF